MNAHSDETLPSHAALAKSIEPQPDATILTVAELRSSISQLPAGAWVIICQDQSTSASPGWDTPARAARAPPKVTR